MSTDDRLRAAERELAEAQVDIRAAQAPAEPCPAPGREGRHENYMTRAGQVCHACGRSWEKAVIDKLCAALERQGEAMKALNRERKRVGLVPLRRKCRR